MSHANDELNSITSNDKKAKSNMFSIFMHADATDVWLMAFGFIGAVGSGLSFSFMFIVSSKIMNIMGHDVSSPDALFIHHINRNVVHFLRLACCSFVLSFLAGYCWTRTGERQASRIRVIYLYSILKQEIEYFDLKGTSTSDVITNISSDNLVIQDVLSEKLPDFIKNSSIFVGSYAVGFILEWRLTIVALPTVLLLIIPGLMYGRMVMNIARKTREEYNKANIIAEQAVSSIRTVYSFVGEIKTMEAFSEALDKSLKLGVRLGLVKGIAIGSNGVGFAIWAFMAWYGSRLVMYHGSLGGNIHAAGVSIVLGGLAFGSGLSNLKYFAEATTAMEHIETVIRRVPKINSDSTEGNILEDIKGETVFQGVYFSYPSRPQSLILNDFNLKVPAGKTVALVGGSGSGKSTVVTMLERFYDPTGGEILIDGENIKKFNLKWLRSQMGYVSQEPTLFATTIKENILVGNEDASMEEVVMATKASNAHKFICRLPQGYDTQVGENGLQLSGGQKQRIAIARAILKSPKILLLDEATSALDCESEHIVQDALDIASAGRTTIVVAHRLSTICNADVIAVVQKGKVVESGSHDELVHNNDSIYSSLVRLQKTSAVTNGKESSSFHPHACTELDYTGSCNSTPANIEGKPNELKDQEHDSTTPSFKRLLALNNPEWMNTVFGCLSSILFGAIQPLYAVTLGSVVSVYFLKDHEEIQNKIEKYSLIFVSLSIFSILLNIGQHYNFGVMGEQLTKRVRERLFSKMLSFEVSWFDQEENSTGAICSRLESDAYVVRSLVGDRIALVMQTLSGVTIAWTMSLAIAWRLAIVMIVVQPIIIASYYARNMLLKGMSSKAMKARSASSKLAVEAVSNIRMVAAFSSQCNIISMFQVAQDESRKESVRQSWFAGFVLGTSESFMCFTWALAFWYGTQLIHHGYINSKSFFQTFIILITTAKAIADAGSTTTDIAKGANMVKSIFSILDRTTLIEPNDPNCLHPDNLKGKIDIIKVDFSYPIRPSIIIFKQLSLTIESQNSVALVGPSGSGKSTIIGLIERFYSPLRGTIKIDDLDIKSYNLHSLRKHIALVGQEPTLFSGSIKDNIAYGSSNVTESELIDAARKANAHDFISCLKDGYDAWCGEKGKQLSGGQKQRIAIARAILKNPKILLLDEATSALDNHSEKAVQEALKYVMVGRTSVVIAHRLSTIENCDEIVVLENGAVVEKGTHDALLGKGINGSYSRLVSLQKSIRNGTN